MNNQRLHEDWVHGWRTSVAVKITAAVLYAIVLIGFTAALIFLQNEERRLKDRYAADAVRIAYKATLLVAENTLPSTEEIHEILSPYLLQAGFIGTYIECCDNSVLWGTRTETHIERDLPVSGKNGNRMLRLVLYHPPVHETVTHARNQLFLLTAVATLLFGFFLTWAILRFISRPVQELISATRQAAGGNYSVRINSSREDEFGQLSRFFDGMIDEIQKEFEERQQAEEALSHAHSFIRTALDSMNDGVAIIDADSFKIMGVNAAFLDEYRVTEAEALGRTCYEVTHHRSDACQPPNDSCPVFESLQTGGHAAAEHQHPNDDGSISIAEVSVSPIKDERGNIIQFVHISRDITSRKMDEKKLRMYAQELKEANEELKNFTSIVSHDLKAPLVSIKGFSNELLETVTDLRTLVTDLQLQESERQQLDALDADLREAVNFIGASVTRMDGLINSVLALSRVGRRDLTLEQVDIKQMVQGILNSLAHQIESGNIAVEIGDLPTVTADRVSLEQIVGNLLDNAIKFLDPGRPGKIAVYSEAGVFDHVFHVRDNGRGISENDCCRIFELFQRAGAQDVPGEGMGLAYVKVLVRRHGGQIWCKSAPGEGSLFSFSIPKEPKTQEGEQIP